MQRNTRVCDLKTDDIIQLFGTVDDIRYVKYVSSPKTSKEYNIIIENPYYSAHILYDNSMILNVNLQTWQRFEVL